MLGHGVSSQHLHRTPAPPWSRRTLEFTLEGKQIVGSLAIGTPTRAIRHCLTNRTHDSFVAIGNLGLQDHHEFLKLRRHAFLAIPVLVDLKNFLHEMTSQPDV